MRDDLLYFYERELTFLRRTGADFARRYPKVANRLLLEANKCEDPHVERLLEGFAFLAARIQLKLDDDFPEISDALLQSVYPHYTRPLPSMSLVEFRLDPEQGKLTSGFRIPRDTLLYSRPIGGVPCKFRTCYDTTLWPLTLASTRWMSPHELRPAVRAADAVAALRLELRCLPDVSFAQLDIDALRLHLSAESAVASTLYELLCNNCMSVLVRDASGKSAREPLHLPASVVRPVGFGKDEGMLPVPRRSFLGYRLLQEYFTFPDKFFFLDLAGFDQIRTAGFGTHLELVFLISSFERADRRSLLEAGVSTETIRLGCTPIVNLFPQTSEPVLLTQRQHEYLVIPDARRRDSTGIFSVEEVVAVTPGAAQPLRLEPLYSHRHATNGSGNRIFWYATRRPIAWRSDEGTDIHLSFVDLSARTVFPDEDAVTVRMLCHNGDMPTRLPFGDPNGDWEMAGGGPIEKVLTLVKPTAVIHPPLGKPQLWRLISQLSLNYLSLVEGGAEALRELLRLHNFADSAAGERQIEGILDVRGSPAYARLESEHGLTFARGQRIEIEFDEEQFAGGGVYLFASVLERFLGLYVSLNSFCILAARTRHRRHPIREWAPRSGWKTLL
jgi:type VI secretion system protein ImpG